MRPSAPPALRAIAGAQAIAGDIQAALATTRTIVNAYNRAWALRSIAEAQAITGDIDRALTTARSIEDAYQRALALSDVTEARLAGADVRSVPAARTPERPAPAPSTASRPESVASGGGPWTAYVEGRGQDVRSQYFGLAWGFRSEAEAAAAARAECIRQAGADYFECDYTETYKGKCVVVGEDIGTESITGNRLAVIYPAVGDTESEAIAKLHNDTNCGNCPIVANSCAR